MRGIRVSNDERDEMQAVMLRGNRLLYGLAQKANYQPSEFRSRLFASNFDPASVPGVDPVELAEIVPYVQAVRGIEQRVLASHYNLMLSRANHWANYLKQPDVADDIFQDFYFVAVKCFYGYRKEVRFSTYLQTALDRHVWNHLDKYRERLGTISLDQVDELAAKPDNMDGGARQALDEVVTLVNTDGRFTPFEREVFQRALADEAKTGWQTRMAAMSISPRTNRPRQRQEINYAFRMIRKKINKFMRKAV